ncbi:hypothetical protein M7I_2181 [Glarea lozoyensis 74030]|uniref:Uncharacterized protein n=1 Tax=Glarea lozoyensis (strain ATCC 74030 / MF5533) TaxID=1104152 RepID=H0EI35_GLAL7|nr:hypothetical protein M7I_2181 [Glarea lozoyensis 74030]
MSLFSEPMLQFHVWDRLCTVIEHLDYHVDNVQADETRGEMTQVARHGILHGIKGPIIESACHPN